MLVDKVLVYLYRVAEYAERLYIYAMAGYPSKTVYVTAAEKAARSELAEIDIELTQDCVDLWFTAYKNPSPTQFSLDFGIDPIELKSEAARNDVVRLALYRIIAVAEGNLYSAVYGPKAVIQRVELFLPIAASVSDAELSESVFAV